ncbi:hypothetical protein GOP47_0019413 [Adiantum capillus-veneris]|uniref:Protein EXORDIUM n=1 Tax=Adiantum capillus-veneris TaxID=13818 RepID=A0A9D4Z717_ADICA|nr:hypothetical protein GOP47_0019413 [Adiantum capillus-veneris]
MGGSPSFLPPPQREPSLSHTAPCLRAHHAAACMPSPPAHGFSPKKAIKTGPNLTYHGGPILSTKPILDVYICWYGHFSKPQRRVVLDFFASLKKASGGGADADATAPSVSSWWGTMSLYKDKRGNAVSSTVKLAGQMSDRKYSMGKQLKGADLETMAARAANSFASDDPNAIYVLITSENVMVEDFCESQCATHGIVKIKKKAVAFMWVGNSASQCPGQCAWPFALPQFMDYSSATETALKAPNDVGMDGVVMNIASILAGAATNPHGNAYYEGNPSVPLEAATACAGIFGPNAYPGAPGTLLSDSTGSSFNARGANSRRFLLPCLWHPLLRICKPL